MNHIQNQNNPEQTVIRRNVNGGQRTIQQTVSGNNPQQTVVQNQGNPEKTVIRRNVNGGQRTIQQTVSGNNPEQTVVQNQNPPEQTVVKHNVDGGAKIQDVVDDNPQNNYGIDNEPKQSLDGLNQDNQVNLGDNPSDDLGK